MQKNTYLIIGSGHLAQHLCFYLTALKLSFQQWSRKIHTQVDLQVMASQSQRILIAISDDAISNMAKNCKTYAQCIHFSGALVCDHASSAHPLMTFGNDLYDENFYQSIPFCIDQEGPPFNELLPGFPNPHFAISQSQKHLYHALVTMAGNIPAILWSEILKYWHQDLHLSNEMLVPYLQQTLKNSLTHGSKSLTGPWMRKDTSTISKHEQALKDSDLMPIYSAFRTYIESKRMK